MLTLRKASNLKQHEATHKRGGNRTQNESDLDSQFLNHIESQEPDPQFAAEVAERCQNLLQQLPEERFRLRTIAMRKMEGYTNDEIRTELGVALSTVELRLKRIRKIWAAENPPCAP